MEPEGVFVCPRTESASEEVILCLVALEGFRVWVRNSSDLITVSSETRKDYTGRAGVDNSSGDSKPFGACN